MNKVGSAKGHTSPDSELAAVLRRQTRNRQIFLFLAFFLLSLNMRAAITSLPPVIQELKEMFHMGGGLAGFLTSIPVLCFGLLTPLIGFLMKRARLEATVFFTLIGLFVGSVVRSSGGINLLVLGTVIIGLSLTVGNIAALLVIGREFPQRISAMTGVYVSGMSIGSMSTMSLTAPLSKMLGWRPALALPAIMALVGVVLWIVVVVLGRERDRTLNRMPHQPKDPLTEAAKAESGAVASKSVSVLGRPLVWILSVAFAAHTFLFYGFTAWMPVYLEQTLQMSGSVAGVAASLFQVLGLLGCFGLPILAGTHRFSSKGLFLVVTLTWFAMAAGFWLLPSWWLLWVISGGISSGGGFTVIFSMIMRIAKNLDENRSMSTAVQTAGYIIAAIAPFAIGYLHEVSGRWQSSMVMLTVASVIMVVAGWVATSGKYGQQ